MHTFFHLDTLVILRKKSLYFNKYSCKETINNRDILKKNLYRRRFSNASWRFIASNPINSAADATQRIILQCAAITGDHLNSVIETIGKCCPKCLQCNGEAFEHLLQ